MSPLARICLILLLSAVVLTAASGARLPPRHQQRVGRLSSAASDRGRNRPPTVLALVVGITVLLCLFAAIAVAAVAVASFFRKLFPCLHKLMDEVDDPFRVAGGMVSSECAVPNRFKGYGAVSSSSGSADVVSLFPIVCGTPAPNGIYLPIDRPPRRVHRGGRVAAVREFELAVLSMATGQFDLMALIGKGVAGAAFRGTIMGHDGLQTPVAIKRFHATICKEMMQSVRSDLAGQPLRHRNLVSLVGAYAISCRNVSMSRLYVRFLIYTHCEQDKVF